MDDEALNRTYPDLLNWTKPEPKPLPADKLYDFEEAVLSLSKDAASRRRFRGKDVGIKAATPELTLGLNFYYWAVASLGERRASRIALLEGHGYLRWAPCSNFLEWASWMNGKAKKLNVALGRDWWVLAEMAGLGGYAPVDESSFLEDIRSWVGVRAHHSSPFSTASWEETYERAAESVFSMLLRRKEAAPATVVSAAEWSSNPLNWGLQGSSFDVSGSRLYVELGGEKVAAQKTKWASALALSPARVKEMIMEPRYQAAKAVAKRETKKVRAVVSSELRVYLQMKYVDHWLQQVLAGSALSTLWMHEKDKVALWASLASGAPAADTDQDQFDHQATTHMVLTFVRLFRRAAEKLPTPHEIPRVLDNLEHALSGGFVDVAGRRIPIVNGVLSGWLWTATLDTLINLAEALICSHVVSRTYGVSLLRIVAQGDDLHTNWTSLAAARKFVVVYKMMDIAVNFSKSIISDRVGEMLRRFGTAGAETVQGYPARAVNGLLWRSPINDLERPGTQRLSGIFERWNTLCGRLGEHAVPADLITDLASGNEISPGDAALWLHTPASLGGAGLGSDPSHLYLNTTTAVRTFSGLHVRPDWAPGLGAVVALAEAAGLRAPAAVAQSWARQLVGLPGKAAAEYGVWESAEFRRAYWLSVDVRRAPLPPLRVPLKDGVAELLNIFPSDENCATTGNPRPPGVSLRWWVARLTGTLGRVNPRFFGYAADWATLGLRNEAEFLAGGFLAQRGNGTRTWESWKYVLATAEVREKLRFFAAPRKLVLLP